MMNSSCRSFITSAVVAAVVLLTASPGAGYRILMVTTPAKSHILPMLAIADGLADRGHNVTVLVSRLIDVSVPQPNSNSSHRGSVQLERHEHVGDIKATMTKLTRMAIENQQSLMELINTVDEQMNQLCRSLLTDSEKLLTKLERAAFHLAVVDCNFVLKCPYLIAHRLHIPFVTYTDGIDPFVTRLPWLPSFVPNMMFNSYTDHMTFVERVINTLETAAMSLFGFFPDRPSDVIEEYRQRYGDFRSLDDLAQQSLLWLITREHINDYARPSMPNVINVGGLTVKQSSAALPPEIKKFINEAPNGAIVVSFGSIFFGLPNDVTEKLIEAFRLLQADGYRFVFQSSKPSTSAEIPRNVLAKEWIPQADLLAHKSVKLFITHCGNSGRYEAVYHGVPMIGFPVQAEQQYNARFMESRGYGIAMDIRHFTVDELVDNVRRVLGTPEFKQRVSKASAIIRSDIQTPVERAAYWIEHVCRFGGEHLRSGGQDLPLYAYLMLDVLASVFVLVSLAACSAYRLTCAVKRRCSSARADRSQTKQKRH